MGIGVPTFSRLALEPVRGSGFRPYYGFGAGVLRLTLGENEESGGDNRSSFHRWLMLTRATIGLEGGPVLVEDGRLLPLEPGPGA